MSRTTVIEGTAAAPTFRRCPKDGSMFYIFGKTCRKCGGRTWVPA